MLNYIMSYSYLIYIITPQDKMIFIIETNSPLNKYFYSKK